MTLRTSLVVSGDTESAQRAVAELNNSLARAEEQAEETGREWTKASVGLERLERAQEEAARAGTTLSNAQKQAAIHGRDWKAGLAEGESQLRRFASANDNVGKSASFSRHHLSNLTYQLQDIAIAAQMGQPPFTILLQQGGQIGQIMGDAGVGVGGLAKELGGLALKFAPAIIAVGAGAAAFALLKDEVSEGIDTDAIIDGLDLTEKQLDRIEDRSLTFGDVMGGVWDAIVADIQGRVTDAFEAMGLDAGDVFEWIVEAAKTGMNAVIGYVTLVPRVLQESWSLMPAAAADIFISAANAGIGAIESLVRGAVQRINAFISGVNGLGLVEFDLLAMPEFGRLENQWRGGAERIASTAASAARDTFRRDFLGETADFASPFIANQFRDRMLAEAGDPGRQRGGGRQGGGRAGALSEEEKALQRANQATERFIAGLRAEIEEIGLDEKALRQLEIQRAKDAAVTKEQVGAIDDLNQQRERAIAIEESRQRAGAIRDETTNVNASIADLEREAQAIGLVGWERERLLLTLNHEAQTKSLLVDLSRALASGTQEEVDAIRAQIDALQTKFALETQVGDAGAIFEEQAAAAERTADSYRHLQRSAAGALSDIALHGDSATGVMKRLALSIADAVLQAALLGEGPLGGIFGGGESGGLLGSLFRGLGFGGGRASGGPVSPGQIYAVNERSTAPGFFVPVGPGRIDPPSNDNPSSSRGAAAASPVYFDLRGAVMTEDLLRQMNSIARTTAGAAVARYDDGLWQRIEAKGAREG